MKKAFLSLIILISSVMLSKPYIQLILSGKGELAKIPQGYTISSVTSSERFYIYFSEAFKTIYKEVKFQDLFTSENLLTGDFKNAEYKLVLNVNDFSIKYFKRKRYYLKDNENGDYIFVNGNYIRVYVGRRYRYDYTEDRFVLDNKNGVYVKAINGQYYFYSDDFYRKIPVDEIWVNIKIDIDYKLYHKNIELLHKRFKTEKEEKLLYYIYDALNKKLLKKVKDENILSSDLANEFSKQLLNELRKKFVIEANVVDFKDVIVIIDKGKEDGVKPGMTFEGNGNIFEVRETTKYTAEAEIIKFSNISLKDVKNLKENQSFKYPLPIHIGAGYSTPCGIYAFLGIRSVDLHWKEKAEGMYFLSYDPLKKKTNYGVSFRINIFKEFFIGFTFYTESFYLYGGIPLFNINSYITVSTSGLGVGGELSW